MSQLSRYLKDEDFKLNIKNNSIYIDNYSNIENLAENNITLTSNNKLIIIEGKNFIIKKLLDKEILFIGEIKNIKFIEQ
jgi:sporulation protein YqfC